MGEKAKVLFRKENIDLYVGAERKEPKELVLEFINGGLITGANTCNHDDHHVINQLNLFCCFILRTDSENSSVNSTSNSFAISINVLIEGCDAFVHHFETVAGSFFKASASHLLVFFLSKRTIFSLLISVIN